VSVLTPKKAFATAGAKEGDIIERVIGVRPETSESLRRALRDALAVGDAAVKVRRGDGLHTLTVSLPE
jgi:S1-C subfamily serine protease